MKTEALIMTHSDIPSSDKLPIAVGIVLDSAAEPLETTLRSAEELSDRIFVVAPEGCQVPHENVTVLRTADCDDDAAARNLLIEAAEAENGHSWLLWLHPGECFDRATVDDLRGFLAEEADRHSLYVMVLHRLFRPDGRRHDLDEETIDPRLMPLGKGLRFQGRLGSSLIPMAETLMLGISAAPGRILCPPKHVDRNLDKFYGERALRILTEMEKAGESISGELLALRGKSYALIGDPIAARRCFLRLIKETEQENLRLSAYYEIWETLIFSPEVSGEMTQILLAALDHFPVDMQLLTFMGAHLQRTGKLDVAARTFETALRYGQISLDVWHRLHIREIAVTSLALVERLRGRAREAIRVLETNLDSIGDRSEYSRHLLDIYIAEGMEEKAKEFAATLWGDVELDRLRQSLTGACLASGGHWDEAMGPLEQAFVEGCRDPLCLRWYSLTLLSLVRFEKAIEVLRLWLEVEPENSEAKSYLFAAQHPESFSEIVRTIQTAQLNSLGIAGAELFQKNIAKAGKKVAPKKGNRAIDDAVREMVASSGTPGRIRCFKPLQEPKPEQPDTDSVEIR